MLNTTTGSVTALKGPIVVEALPFGGKARGNYGEPLWHLGSFGLHTAPMESSFFCEVNFGIHRRPRASVISIPGLFTYALYIVIAFVLEVIFILLSHCCLFCLA